MYLLLVKPELYVAPVEYIFPQGATAKYSLRNNSCCQHHCTNWVHTNEMNLIVAVLPVSLFGFLTLLLLSATRASASCHCHLSPRITATWFSILSES
jgi:hypothetical protein